MSKNIKAKQIASIPRTRTAPTRQSEKPVTNSIQNIHLIILVLSTFILYGWTYSFHYSLSDPYILGALSKLPNNLNSLYLVFSQSFATVDYRPVSILSFCIERLFVGYTDPHVSHLVNVFLYSIISILIYQFVVVCKFMENKQQLHLLAFLCAFLFIIHPNHVSVVANIKSRDNLLSMLFGLAGCIQFIKLIDDRKLYRIVWMLLLFYFAFLSKLDVYAFLSVPVFIVYLFRNTDKKTIFYIAAGSILLFLIIVISRSAITTSVTNNAIINMTFDKNPLVGNDTFINRLSLTFTSLFYYLKFLVIPSGYHFIFGYNQIPLKGLFCLENMIAISTICILTFLAIKKFYSNKIYIFCLLFFIFSITYALNYFDIIANIVMDRYNFIPSLAFCLALAALCIEYYKSYNLTILNKIPFLLLIVIHIFFTVYRTKDWKNLFVLVEHDLPYLSNSMNAHRIAGAAYINEALAEEMKPNYNKLYADSLIQKGERYIDKAIQLYDKEPQSWEAKGLCYFYRREYYDALRCFKTSTSIDSTYLSSINYTGFTYWKLNKTDSAYYCFNYVMNREFQFNYSANNMINMLIELNRKTEADSLIRVLVKKYPDDIWLNKRIEELYKNTFN